MQHQLPSQLQYAVSLVQHRWHQLKDAREDAPDAGIETLEVIVLAAALVVAAVAVGAFLVGKINEYQSKIK